MSPKFFQFKSFITYWLDAEEEHSLHSPFFFDFYSNIVKKKIEHPAFPALKQIRKNLQLDQRTIHVTDFGAGSFHLKNRTRRINDIVRISSTPEKYSRLYASIIHHFEFNHILELGTSLGINTLYLAKAFASAHVTTFEGSPETSNIAQHLFTEINANNIRVVEGNIDYTLPHYLSTAGPIDFVLMDANHRVDPTLHYFGWLIEKIHHQSIIVLDDIHYSPEMEKAWKAIQEHNLVYATIDLFRCGLIFFDPSLNKQNVVLQF